MQLDSFYVAKHTYKKGKKYLYWYLNINKSHQQMLKQLEIDCEKNIIFGYCCEGTTGVKKEIEYFCKIERNRNNKKFESIFISFCGFIALFSAFSF